MLPFSHSEGETIFLHFLSKPKFGTVTWAVIDQPLHCGLPKTLFSKHGFPLHFSWILSPLYFSEFLSFFSEELSSRQLLNDGDGLLGVFAYLLWSNSDIQWLVISARCINLCTKQYFSKCATASALVKALSKVPLSGRWGETQINFIGKEICSGTLSRCCAKVEENSLWF